MTTLVYVGQLVIEECWCGIAATRGHMTRLKKRVAAGVCPCCQRTFHDVARHMKCKHPDYPKEAEP